MARKLIVAVAVDLTQYVRGMGQAAKVTEVLDRQVKELDVNVTQLAQAQVAASVKATERLRSQAAAYRQLAASAERGSHEQVAAARLAGDAERRLASSLGATTRETNALRSSTRGFERDLSHAARGALSGSGILHGFGRSLAFASGGFLAFHGVTEFLRDSVNAAREAGVAQRSLAAQMKTSGESFQANREQIERAALSYGKFGFQNDEVIASLTVLERGTGKISQALKLQGLAADIARAKNIGLSAAATVVAKVFGGQETALRRAVPGLAKNAHGWDLIRLAQAKMAGQAAANTTVSEALAATLHDTEEIIGTGLLPTLNKYLTSLGAWLQRMNESGKLQKDVADATDFLASAIAAARAILAPFIRGFQLLAQVTGSTTNAIKTLGTAFLAWKITGLVSELGLLSTGIKGVGTSAVVAEGEVAGLRGGLAKLGAIGPITIGVTVAFSILNTPEYKEAQKKAQSHAGPFARILDNLKQVPRDLNDIVSKQEKMWNDLAAKIGLPNRRLDQLFGSRRRPATPIVTDVTSGGGYGAAIPAGPSAADVQKVKRTAQQLNQWFDAAVGRRLSRVGDLPLRQQLVELGKIGDLISQRIRKTNDVTRKLTLNDQLYAIQNQKKAARQQLAEQFAAGLDLKLQAAEITPGFADDLAALDAIGRNLDKRIAKETDIGKKQDLESQKLQNNAAKAAKRQEAADLFTSQLQFNIDKAGLTKTLNDDIAGWDALIRNLDVRIARETDAGKRLDLENQKLAALQGRAQAVADRRQQAADAIAKAAARRQAQQFKALGFGPTGEDLVPTGAALRKQMERALNAITGTKLDTSKVRGMLNTIRKVLSGAFGKVTAEVRQKIEELLAGLFQQITDARAQSKQAAQDAKQAAQDAAEKAREARLEHARQEGTGGSGGFGIGAGYGVTAAMIQGRFVGPGGVRAPYMPRPIGRAGPTVGVATATSYTINGGLNLYGVQNVSEMEAQLQKRTMARPQTRRGPV